MPKEIGWGNANRYILTGEGDGIPAEEAYRLGPVSDRTRKQFDKASEVTRRIASVAPLGVQGALKHSRITYLKGEDAVKDVLWEDTSAIMKSEDMKEGVQSFLERRPAVLLLKENSFHFI